MFIIKQGKGMPVQYNENIADTSDNSILQTGTVSRRRLPGSRPFHYYLYLPLSYSPASPVLVSVHGISRNALEHVEHFSSFAEKYGFILIAPLFSKKHYRGYQRLGRHRKKGRADLILSSVVEEVKKLTGNTSKKSYFFGFSGGAQFVHRYLMAYPEHVERAVIAAAGWYTFPDPTLEYPLGIKASAALPGASLFAPGFLSVPVSVLVGEFDNEQDAELRKSRFLFHQQGLTRIERGMRWAKVMTAASRSYNINTLYPFQLLPESDHSFLTCMTKGNMGAHIVKFLFD